MSDRVLVLGGAGMLGHKVFQVLGRTIPDTFCTVRGPGSRYGPIELLQGPNVLYGVDATDEPMVAGLIRGLRPAVVVNCVGVVKQRAAAHDPLQSIRINSLLPHQLAALCTSEGVRLIHVSTDCVFRGDRGGYTEDDPGDALDLYGRSKLLGEPMEGTALTIRTSIIGRELSNFESLLEWFLRQRGEVPGYPQAFFSGLTTTQLASVIGSLIGQYPGLSGLYHVAGPRISKFDLLQLISKSFGLNTTLRPDDTVRIDRSLNGDPFAAATGLRSPSWEEMVEEMAADDTPYERWRT